MIPIAFSWFILIIVGGVESCADPGQPIISSVINNQTTDRLYVSWSASLGSVDYYNVFLTGGGDDTFQTSLTYRYITGLLPGREYNITVQAVQGSCKSNSSTVMEATYPSAPGSLIYRNVGVNVIALRWDEPQNMEGTRSVNPPSFITVNNNGYTDRLYVSWLAAAGIVDYYTVYVQGDVPYQLSTTYTYLTLLDLLPGKEYTIYVETVSGADSAKSTGVTEATYPTPPGSLITKDIQPNLISLKWNNPANMSDVNKNFKIALKDPYNTVIQSDTFSTPAVQYSNIPKGYYTVTIYTVGARQYPSLTVAESVYMPYDSTPVGAIVGGVIGGVVGLCLLGFAIFWIVRFLKNRRTKPRSSNTSSRAKDDHDGQYDQIIDPPNRQNLPPKVGIPPVPPLPTKDSPNPGYVPGQNFATEYIVAKDPVPGTEAAFWTLVWDYHINIIVMLSECDENFKVQGMEYWPSESPGKYGNVQVEVPPVHGPSQNDYYYWKVRRFAVTNANVKGQGSLDVQQFHFGSLDQKGDRDNREVFIRFVKLVHRYRNGNLPGHPILVHCRNGFDRSGLFIALSRILTQLQQSKTADVHGIIADVKRHQPNMIQTAEQYSYLCKCSEEIINTMESPEYSGMGEEPAYEAYETQIVDNSVRA